MEYKNIEDKKEYDRKYRQEHSEEIKIKNKEWRSKNQDLIRQNAKKWRLKNIDKVRYTGKIRMKTWRDKNPERHRNNVRTRRLMILEQIWEYKSKGCSQCQEKDPRCIDFHHRNPEEKSFNISTGLSNKLSLETLMKEILKCDLLCRNCHVKTYKRIFLKK